MSLEFERRLAGDQKRIEEALGAIFREDDRYADLQEAMEYSLMAGGKRVRPVLTLECCRLCGGDPERALPFACGVEMVHTYSLIHDDLPCMDDDDLRRGRPTNHRVYGEATAVLAGDGLLTAAFQMLTARRDLLSPEQMAEGVDCLSRAAGPSGMVGGQVLDMAGEGRSLSLSELELLQSLKTGALISAAAELGCEAVWIMDDDTLPEPDALAALLAADAAHGDGYGWLSSRALAPDGTDQPMNLQRKTMYRDIDGFDAAEVPAVMASFVSLFLRTEAVRQFGLPIAEFFIWSDDWEYTRRISRAKPCYVIPASRVVHAMQNPGVVNIARDVPARWARYRYFYRNDVVLYRREGLSGWLWLLAKDSWHTVQVLRDRQGCRAERIKIIWKGFAAGVRFRPQIPYLP